MKDGIGGVGKFVEKNQRVQIGLLQHVESKVRMVCIVDIGAQRFAHSDSNVFVVVERMDAKEGLDVDGRLAILREDLVYSCVESRDI